MQPQALFRAISRLEAASSMIATAAAVALLSCGMHSQRYAVRVRSSTVRGTRSTALAASPAVAESTGVASSSGMLLDAAKDFINTKSGFYSPYDADAFAEDFVFRGPVIGPLNKPDYLSTMDTFKVYKAFPDILPNAFGFAVDPMEPQRVWFFVRNTGTNTGPFELGYGLEAPPSNNAVEGVPEAFSITFDEDKRVKLLTVGYVVDRFQGNTGGVGAAFGLLRVAGIPLPGGLLYRAAVALSNRLPGATAKSCSMREDVPAWWLERSEERGPDGYNL